jgi:amino acid transporter
MGLMVSPEALRLQGNVAGLNGLLFLLPLGAAVGLHGLNVRPPSAQDAAAGRALDEIQLLTDSFGPLAGSLMLLLARPAVAICLATATLVTSGFIFNETFVYWFPNFAFAGLLLVCITAITLAGPRVAAIAQLMFLLTAVGGLFSLSVIAWWGPAKALQATPGPGFTKISNGLLWAVPAFIGYDLLRYTGTGSDPRRLSRRMALGLLLAGLLFLAWNSAALRVVPAERLAQTNIPQIVSARAIAGHTGRLIMGIVGIAGSCAAVLLLFHAVARMSAQMARSGLLPVILGHSQDRPWIAVSGLTAVTGALMAMGFAGSAYLDIALRAGLLLWLLVYAGIQLAVVVQRRNQGGAAFLPKMVCAVMLLVVVVLAAQDPERTRLVAVMLFMVALVAILAWAGLAANARSRQ